MVVEPITGLTPRPVGRALMAQGWREVTFVHWAVDPALVAGLLPVGTRPDTLDGVTFVGLIPFRLHRLGVPDRPALPYFGTFCETNVRLYSVDDDGRRGVVFLSLDAARLLPVLTARAGLRMPYMWAGMRSVRRAGDVVAYASRRRWPGPAGAVTRVVVRTGERIGAPSPLERFLTARWGLHVAWYGRTLYIPNEHPEWPLHRAELLALDDRLVEAAGLPAPAEPPVSVVYSPGVRARFGRPFVVARPPGVTGVRA
ncbi:DUF2071 domain-containing protein [Streptosporangium sp. KLBMP 9127]|nr:DUF2071 domain-containing protein [Streptosporangium sp. KLBMP 9127]